MKTSLLTFLLTLSLSFSASAQLFIDTTITAEQMVMDFFDNTCVTPSNISFQGGDLSITYFDASNTALGIPAGILISTGDNTIVPLSADEQSDGQIGTGGDDDLSSLAGDFPSNDAAVLEFDIFVQEDGILDFKYIFASEEYPEFVCSVFNDVFAFLIRADGEEEYHNIAMVPDSDLPVAINSVNPGVPGSSGQNENCLPPQGSLDFSTYYVDNTGSTDLIYDGMTSVLPAEFEAIAGQSYHVKIAVADVSDSVFDSGVFIATESLCGEPQVQPHAVSEFAVDGNTVTVVNQSRYGTAWHWDFGDGETSDERYPEPHTYAEAGQYTITLTTTNFCCTDSLQTTLAVEASNNPSLIASSFKVFPNPVKDLLYIQNDEVFEYQLLDINGKIVRAGQNAQQVTLTTHDLERGLYILRVQSDAEQITQKIQLQ